MRVKPTVPCRASRDKVQESFNSGLYKMASHLLALLVLFLLVGCGGGGHSSAPSDRNGLPSGGNPPPAPQVGEVVLRFQLQARQVPPEVLQIRLSAFGNAGQLLKGPQLFSKASVIRWQEVPVATTRIQIEYLDALRVRGLALVPILIQTGGVVEVVDPDFSDVPALLQGIQVHPGSSQIPLGIQSQWHATGHYNDGSTLNLTQSVQWSSENPNIASVEDGKVTGVEIGSTTIRATLDAIEGSAEVAVTRAVLQQIQVSPAHLSLAIGTGASLQASGRFSDSSTQDLTSQVIWTSDEPATATITLAGEVTAVSKGSTTLRATLDAVQGSAEVTVTEAVLQQIQVTPANLSLAVGTGASLQATGLFSDSSTQDLTSQVIWTSDEPATATITLAGEVNAVSQGSTILRATLDSVQGSAQVLVTPEFPSGTSRLSLSSAGVEGNHRSSHPSLSADGRFVAFVSLASNLVSNDSNGTSDVFVHDRRFSRTTRVSLNSEGGEGNAGSNQPSLSADGRFVAFASSASNLVANDTNGTWDIFVNDRQTGTTTRISVDSAGGEGDGFSVRPSISANGRFIAFESYASNLVANDTNGTGDIFIHDRQTGATTRASINSEGLGANSASSHPSISADGRLVAFASLARNLVANDTNSTWDIYVHDRQTGTTSRVSVNSAGMEGNHDSNQPSISEDGRFIAFDSFATNLVPNDTNEAGDVFVHDRQSSTTIRVSRDSTGGQGNDSSLRPSISADGRFVAFHSIATNLVFNDTNGTFDAFLHDLQTAVTTRISQNSAGTEGNTDSNEPALSADGLVIGFSSDASNLVESDTNGFRDIFILQR